MPRHKDVVFVGSALKDLKAFPIDARRAVLRGQPTRGDLCAARHTQDHPQN